MTLRRLYELPFLALLALAAACSDGSDPIGGGPGGSLAFSHAGTGEAPTRWETFGTGQTNDPDADWALAIFDGVTLGVSANRRTAGNKHDEVAIGIADPATQSVYTVGDCETCAVVNFTFGQVGHESNFERACTLTAGTLKLTEYSEDRAKGTFSGTGTCFHTPGEEPDAFTVTNGSFDVAIHETTPV
jgi:hypothetical protein